MAGAIPTLPPAFPLAFPSWVANKEVWLWDKAVEGGGGYLGLSISCWSPLLVLITFMREHLLL